MHGPRVNHNKWSKADKKGKYGIAYMWNLKKKKNDINTLIYQKEIKYGFQRGKVRG